MKFKTSTLGNIAFEIKTGKTPPTANQEYFGNEISWYTPGDLDKTKDLADSQRGITQLAIDEKKAILFKPNTVLIGCIGDIGKIGIAKTISSSNQQITGIYPIEKEISTDFLYYWLKRNKRLLQNASTSAIVPILNNKQLASIRISYPENLTDQIKIAHVLSKAEALIKQRKESIDLLDDFLKSTFLKMFGDNKKMSASKLELLGDNISYLTSGSRGWAKYYSKSGAKFLRIQNIGGGIIRTDNLIYVTPPSSAESDRTRVKEGDLIISITADLGRTSVVPKDFGEAYINQHLALIRLNNNIHPIFAAYFYNMPFGNNAIQKKNRAAVKAGLNFNDIKTFPILIPSFSLQTQFAKIVEETETLKIQYQRSIQEFENLYGSLSQKAFKGELDLSLLEISPEEEEYASYTNDRTEDHHFPEPKFKVEKKKKEVPIQEAQTKPKKESSPKTNLNWEGVSTQQMANWIIDKYEGFHFNSEMLIRFLMDEHITVTNYFSSEVLKKNPQTNEADDLKSFVFSAIEGENPFLNLEQVFYDGDKENFTLKITPEDYELLKNKSKEERSGIYFNIIK